MSALNLLVLSCSFSLSCHGYYVMDELVALILFLLNVGCCAV